ncbi:MAG: SMC-Scp complex subunit ScpB [bacterium]
MPSKKAIVEAVLFSSARPLKVSELKSVLGGDVDVEGIIDELESEYRSMGRAITIRRIGRGYQMFTRPELAPYIDAIIRQRRRTSLSRAALETLSIIAYKQPATKTEIEWIRGVDSSGVIKGLFERGLITVVGRSSSIGKPLLYGTTDKFLEMFGLTDISDLPDIHELNISGEETVHEGEIKQVSIEGWGGIQEEG